MSDQICLLGLFNSRLRFWKLTAVAVLGVCTVHRRRFAMVTGITAATFDLSLPALIAIWHTLD